MLHDNAELAKDNQRQLTLACVNTQLQTEGMWKCFFDGAYSKEGTGDGFFSQDEHIQDHNIGTQKEPKLVKLFKEVSLNYKERYIKLFRQYIVVLAWSYEDLKAYEEIMFNRLGCLVKVITNNAQVFSSKNLDGETLQLPVNWQYLKQYFQF